MAEATLEEEDYGADGDAGPSTGYAEDEAPAAQPRRGPGRPRKTPLAREEPVPGAQTAAAEEAIDIRNWLESIGSKQDVKIQVIRKLPRFFKGKQIEGLCASYSELIDDDFIKETFGGGLYQIAVHKRSLKHGGRMNFFASKMLRIAGDPKIEALVGADEQEADDGSVAGQAMRTMHLLTKNAMDKAEKAAEKAERERGSSNGMDPMLMQAIVAPMQAQIASFETTIREMNRTLAEKDARIIELITGANRRSDTPTFQDRMLEKMVDGESARVETLRANHEAELRQLKNIHQAELDRERNRLEEEIRRAEKRHERELDAVRDASRTSMEAQKVAYETRIDGLKSEAKRLGDDVAANKLEIAELRAKKEKTLPEQAKEIVAVQEALQSLGVGGKDDDEDEGKSAIERIVNNVIDNPEAIGQLLGGVRGAAGGGGEPQMSPEQAQMLQAQQQQAVLVQQAQARQLARKRAAKRVKTQQAQAIAATAEASGVRPPDPNEVRLALSFMEAAIQNGTDPAAFAATAKSAVPGDVLMYIEKVGIDEILNAANLPQDSLLRTQKGRNFSRAVAKCLLEGTAA